MPPLTNITSDLHAKVAEDWNLILTKHARLRGEERQIYRRTIAKVLASGAVVEDQSEYGRTKWLVAGRDVDNRDVAVAVECQADRKAFIVVTVFLDGS